VTIWNKHFLLSSFTVSYFYSSLQFYISTVLYSSTFLQFSTVLYFYSSLQFYISTVLYSSTFLQFSTVLYNSIFLQYSTVLHFYSTLHSNSLIWTKLSLGARCVYLPFWSASYQPYGWWSWTNSIWHKPAGTKLLCPPATTPRCQVSVSKISRLRAWYDYAYYR